MKKKELIIFIIFCMIIVIMLINVKQRDNVKSQLYNLSKNNTEIQEIYNNYQEYPSDILELLINDQDTLEFVKYYQTFKENPTIPDNIGNLSNNVPLLLQWDKRWGYLDYGSNCIAINGCGPTCLSMVISYLKQDNTITPYTIAKYSLENNNYEEGVGTKWELMINPPYNINSKELTLNKNQIIKELNQNHPIICSMKKGNFTNNGHYIVITKYIDGKFQVNDPNSIKRSEILWDYETLEYQIKNLWSYSL